MWRRKKTRIKTVIRKRGDHSVSRKDIDPDALKVLYRLSRHGHVAYLVGGGVRDLLLGGKPKDFDVSTDAHPNQIKKLFRNCFLIGRRFRLAHIRFGSKIIETSTFRRIPDAAADPKDENADLFNKHDNTFGTPEEDALRRDFTINGLFYDIKTFSVIDHVDGLRDLDRRVIRSIGDPRVRFREDPVRMLRAARFASRLGFSIDRADRKAILRYRNELAKSPPSRLIEEIYKLFTFESGEEAFRIMKDLGLLRVLFPEINTFVDKSRRSDVVLLWRCLAGLDASDNVVGAPSPVMIFAALFCAPYRRLLDACGDTYDSSDEVQVARDMLESVAARLQMPRRVFHRVVWVLASQHRFGPGMRNVSKNRFVAMEGFPEALALRQIWLQANDKGEDDLSEWLALNKKRPAIAKGRPGPDDSVPPDRRRRPRRSRRYGGRRP